MIWWIVSGVVLFGLLILAAAALSLLRRLGRLGSAVQRLSRLAAQAQQQLQPSLMGLAERAGQMQQKMADVQDRAAVLKAVHDVRRDDDQPPRDYLRARQMLRRRAGGPGAGGAGHVG